jgi:hypothetical protein
MSEQSPHVDKMEFAIPAVAAGADDTTPLGPAPFDGTVTGVTFIPDAAITGANTDTRKVSIVNAGQAGAGTTEVAALQFNAGVNAAVSDEKALTLSATPANRDAVTGDVLSWKSDKVGTGIADPGGTVVITYSRK